MQSATMIIAALAALAVGCAAKDATGGNPAAGATAQGSGQVRCTLYNRPSNVAPSGATPTPGQLEFQEVVLELGPNESESIELGALTLSVSYRDAEFEAASIDLSVEAGSTPLVRTLYQLEHRKLPANQFVGDHGFTGLMYLTHPTEGGDYQLICKSAS